MLRELGLFSEGCRFDSDSVDSSTTESARERDLQPIYNVCAEAFIHFHSSLVSYHSVTPIQESYSRVQREHG